MEMRLKAVSGVMLILLVASVLALAFDIQSVEASGTIYIRADGSVEGTDKIERVGEYGYIFTDNINDSIVVERDNIVIDGAGYTLQGPGISGTGIYVSERQNVTIKNTGIRSFEYGIRLSSSSNNTIFENRIESNADCGILFDSSSNYNIIYGNNITEQNFGWGIRLTSSNHNNIFGNKVKDNGLCIQINVSSNNNITGNIIDSYESHGIILVQSSNNTISENDIRGNPYAGIALESSSNNKIFKNNIGGNDEAIDLEDSSYNVISGNTIRNHNWMGIRLVGSSNHNVISGNTISSSWQSGIYVVGQNNSISDNLISNNGNNGAFPGSGMTVGSYNTIIGNTISYNTRYGIYLQGINNVLYHNNFVDNTLQIYVFPGVNVLDNGFPSGGNYWSNYTGVDSDHDGIGDTEHLLDTNNTDHFPLMGMFSDFNATSEYHVQTICNSSISDFQYNGTAICFNVTGENDTTGFCRICVPRALMNETYKVFVNGTEVQCNLLPCSNTTHSYLYFTYTLSTQEVIIIPEFPAFLIPPLFMIATLLAAMIFIRKHRANLRIPV